MKACMQSFIDYKHTLDDVERDGLEDSAEDTYEKQFMKLRDLTSSFKTDGLITTVDGERKCISNKNRYKDILPYDQTRVKLKEIPGVIGSDYINACHIQGATANQQYIAAQGPLPESVNDFWRMLWENNVRVILMACNEYEGFPRKLRCQRYWAINSEEKLTFGDIVVCLLKEQQTNYEEFIVHHLRATRGSESRDVVHLHYTMWPDRGTPKCVPSIVSMIEMMREFQSRYTDDNPPVVVHCSAGCGRTGTILVIDYVMNMIKFGKLSSSFSLFEIILEMRKQRMAIVQALDQYVFVHEAVVELFRKQLDMIDQHEYYNTVDPVFKVDPHYELEQVAPNNKQPVDSAYEDIVVGDLNSRVVPKLPKLPIKADNLPTVKDKQAGPEYPSLKLPKPVTPKKPCFDQGQFFSPSLPNNDDFVTYSMPFNKQPVVVKQAPASSPVRKSSSPENFASYSEVNYPSKNISDDPYAYADPDAPDRWALQHIARRNDINPASSEYAEVSAGSDVDAYATVDFIPDTRSQGLLEDNSEADADSRAPPVVPRKTSQSEADSLSSNINIFNKIKQMVNHKTQQPIRQPAAIIFRGIDMSYPNRVGKPKYGPRPLKSQSFQPGRQ